MSRFHSVFAALAACAAVLCAPPVLAASALAHLGRGGATIEDRAGVVLVTVPLTLAVPWKVHLADDPPRLVIEFNDLEWSQPPKIASSSVSEVGTARHAPGWSQMVAVLREPLEVGSAEMETAPDGTATLIVRLSPTTAADFRAAAQVEAAVPPDAEQAPARPVIAIDPGHGGFDPGAEVGGLVEADITLAFARRLKEVLVRSGRFDVVLTRDEDVFVPLEDRLTLARAGGAGIFISLHADTLEADAGDASGVTVYTLSDEATDAASERLAERHEGSDIIAGADLSGAGDDVALALLDLARQDTQPRTAALSATLIAAFRAGELAVNSSPERRADLSVLKSADIPSVLIELGFLSSKADIARLESKVWQQEAARAVRDALLQWHDEDRLRSEAMRK